jgi:hypothetical protein
MSKGGRTKAPRPLYRSFHTTRPRRRQHLTESALFSDGRPGLLQALKPIQLRYRVDDARPLKGGEMTRCHRISLSILIVSALGAAGAGVASAVPYTAPGAASTQITYLTGKNPSAHILKTASMTTGCATATFAGSMVGSSQSSLTLTPTYSGCTSGGFATSHVKVNGCDFLFTEPTSSGGITYSIHAPHISCPAGKVIEITPTTFGVSVCTQKIPPQTPTSGVVFVSNSGNIGAMMDFYLQGGFSGVHYSGTGSICSNSETHSDGEYSGPITVEGFSDSTHEISFGVTVD